MFCSTSWFFISVYTLFWYISVHMSTMVCQFYCKAEHIQCSEKYPSESAIKESDKVAVYTECGWLPSSYPSNINICLNHFQHFLEINNKRRRRIFCEVPVSINCHKLLDGKRKADRLLSLSNVEIISVRYGVVLPVGTGICRDCRKVLVGGQDHSENHESESEKTDQNIPGNSIEELFQVPTNQTRKKSEDSPEGSLGLIPAKRARKTFPFTLDSVWSTEGDSQETFDSQTSLSQTSSISDSLKFDPSREALNKFLGLSGLSPVKELQGQISEASRRTQLRYIEKAKQCFDLMCKTICPGEDEFLKSAILEKDQRDQTEVTLETLVEIYKRADTWDFQRQILSIIADQHTFDDVKKLIPEITQYKFKAAKKHCKQMGIGEPVPKTKFAREKFDTEQLEHFIDFITSGDIIKDQPFGEKTLKLNGGEIIKIPSVIRSLAPSRIITQYNAICKEENVKPLGTSTLYKLLDDCSALVRKGIEGLDNFVMEGCRAFRDLESIVHQLGMTSNEAKSVQENLQNAKRYLKSELKIHATRDCKIADHCLSFALSSSSEPYFKSLCDHMHNISCRDCEQIDTTLTLITEKAEQKVWENKEAALYTVEESVSAIRKWKSHVIRSRNQEEARSAIVEEMTDAEAVITCDWAMKFLPRKYREGQVDWFAKRGINWHITVSLLKDHSLFTTVTHIHVFESPTSQDATVTSQILIDVARDLMMHRQDLKHLHLFSDNAGCYKSSYTLLTLQQELSGSIVSYNFCEAQNGKGPCDRRASHVKSIIRRYINEGHDVITALHMKQAIDREKKTDIKVKVVSSVNILDVVSRKSTIPNISQMYNFHFTDNGLRMWKAFSVGEGKLLKWNSLGSPSNTTELKTMADWIGGDVIKRHIGGTEEVENTAENGTTTDVLECPKESCTKKFSSQKSVDQHILMGNCDLQGVKMSISEKAKRLYAEKVISIQPNRSVYVESTNAFSSTNSLEMGWAIKETKPRVSFSERQKDFMTDKYNIGKVTGNKVDPYIAAEEMRNSGNYKKSEFLSGQQIASFFFPPLSKGEENKSGRFHCSRRGRQKIYHKRFTVKIKVELIENISPLKPKPLSKISKVP